MSSMTILPGYYIIVAAVVFCIGAGGAIARRNALILLMSIELMLNAANLLFITYAKEYGSANGHAVAFFVMAIAAAEAALGLAIVLGVFRTRQTVDVDELDSLRDET
jgi:NADH-quinone oxidoreductase subunit K